ncbi:hypothetical protein ScPMuIL_001066 [Solemya velum]
MHQTVDVCRKVSGKIWHRNPTPSSDNGLMVTVSNSQSGALSGPARNVRFLHTAFDNIGDSFVAGDHQGHVYLFDIAKNRFSLVQKSGVACTALAFNLRRRSEFLMALSDYSLKCYDTDTKEMVAWMKGHESAIHSISVHASGRYALTTSADTAQLWDLDTFQRKRKLNIKEDVDIVQVFFLPLSNTIVTCFKDDTIFAWESDTLKCKYQLPVPPGKSPNYKAYAATRDGRMLVAGGRSRFIHVWSLDTQRLMQIVELPNKVTSVKQLQFLSDNFDGGSSQVLGVLCQDGIMRFINVNTCKLLFDIGSLDNRILNVSVSPNGRHVTGVMEDGNLHIYNVHAISSELNKPPAPLVKVVKSNKMADTTITNSSDQSVSTLTNSKLERNRRKKISFEDSLDKELPEGLKLERLLAILHGYGEYPSKYRMFIWRSVLRLPENHAAYAALFDKGTHPSYAKLHELYPIKSRKLLRVLQRILSVLANWSPIFGETQYLPVMSFPFVKLFQNNHLVCFEIIATILANWSQHWFEYFPNPPINILSLVENVLAYHDNRLLQHFVKYNVTSQIYAWPLLETLFSEVLTKDEWLCLWDNVFSNHPSFLLMVVVAYAVCARGPLMQCVEIDDFKYFFHHQNAVDVKQVIKEAYRIFEGTPEDIHPRKNMEYFKPLTKGQYPVFNKYPKFIVDYQIQERQRIRNEELEFLRQKQVSMDVQKETVKKQHEEEAWYRQQQLLMQAEERRRKMIQDEEQKLVDQRKRLQAMSREMKLKELQLLDAARRKFLHFQRQQREGELRRLDDEVQRKALQRDQETEAAIEEAEIKNMELQLQKKMFEQELFRDHAISSFQMRTENDVHRKQEELELRIQQRMREAEEERGNQVRKVLQEKVAKASQQNVDAWTRNNLDYQHRMEEADREAKQTQLSKLHGQNRTLEGEVETLMSRCQIECESGTEAARQNLEIQQRLSTKPNLGRLDTEYLDSESSCSKFVYHFLWAGEWITRSSSVFVFVSSGQEDDRSSHSGLQYQSLTSPASDLSSRISIDRSRRAFDDKELALLNGVRQLRQRLAVENRNKKPPRVSAN